MSSVVVKSPKRPVSIYYFCVFVCFLSVFIFLLVWGFLFWKVSGDVGPEGPHSNLTLPFYIFLFCFGFAFFGGLSCVLVVVGLQQTHQTYQKNIEKVDNESKAPLKLMDEGGTPQGHSSICSQV